ncbi:hypothetical protein NMY22_g8285 [Coprinellus aureogranulatus]|nr:hypothetical protein NMY22_g8285 [Coprinellus aureogranulatus]
MDGVLLPIEQAMRTLSASPLFRPQELSGRPLSQQEQWEISIQRSAALAKAIALPMTAIRDYTDLWWGLQLNPIFAVDAAACTMLSIQLNLVAGTLTTYVDERPDLLLLLEKVLKFDVFGHFCLTEVEHGLDAKNLETTATQLPGGGFDLHTPHHGAAKFMPPTAPSGIPGIGIVFARLIIAGKDCGVRTFIVKFCDGKKTYPGVTVRILNCRVGSKPVKHSITSFHHVQLPQSALLGEAKPSGLSERDNFNRQIWRITGGAISLTGMVISRLKMSCYIAGKYSQRSTVAGPPARGNDSEGPGRPRSRVPIITFSTQHRPILIATVNAFVLQAFYWHAARFFSDFSQPHHQSHAMGAIFKMLVQRLVQADLLSLSERCGAQGMFAHNQMSTLLNDMRGNAIAEGDTLVLSIRLIAELVQGKYALPNPKDPKSILYHHEQGLFDEVARAIKTVGHHRSDTFNRIVLPRCEKITLSIGHRMAYDAAVDAGLSPLITNLYKASAVQMNEGWFAEKMGYTRENQFHDLDRAVQDALPHLDQWLEDLGVEEYVSAPIIHHDRWMDFFHNLEIAPSHGDSDATLVSSAAGQFGQLKARL